MEQAGMRSIIELPSQRLKKLQKEIEELEAELRQMEKEEIPTENFGCLSETELALQEIDFIREQMRAVSDSEPFKAFETFQSALKKGESDDIASYEDLVNQDVENILA